MRVKAVVSFSGTVSMAKGDERDITNDVLLEDLLQAGYVVTLEEQEPEVATSQEKTRKKGVKSNEN